MIEIKLSSESIDELRVHVAALDAVLRGVEVAAMARVTATAEPQPTTDAAPKRTRRTKAEMEAAKEVSQPALDAQASDVDLFATATPATVVEQKQPELKDLIAAMRALNDKKGTDAVIGIVKGYGAKTVPAIPKDKWAEAIATADKFAA